MGAVQHRTRSTAASCLKFNILSSVLCSHNLFTVHCTKKNEEEQSEFDDIESRTNGPAH